MGRWFWLAWTAWFLALGYWLGGWKLALLMVLGFCLGVAAARLEDADLEDV